MSCYLAIDGPDGCGKSTQAAALVHWLDAEGADVLRVREPGSTPVGEALRSLLLSPQTGDLQPITEVLLFSAARAELMTRVVRPAQTRPFRQRRVGKPLRSVHRHPLLPLALSRQ